MKKLPPMMARTVKRVLVYPRFWISYAEGTVSSFFTPKASSRHNVLFIAGMPKSGTTWLEKMVSSYHGVTAIMPCRVTSHEMKHKSSVMYELPGNTFAPLFLGTFVMKMHIYGSEGNARVLKEAGIPYVIMYRDIRDAAVSHYFYVRATSWHPETEEYRDMEVKEGLLYFARTRAVEWMGMVEAWLANRDPELSIVVTYEDLLADSYAALRKVAEHYGLDSSEATVKEILEHTDFQKLKKADRGGGFFRKGVSGDWRNYFDEDVKKAFKDSVGPMILKLGYEKDMDW